MASQALEVLRLKAAGQHLLVEYHNCDCTILNDRAAVEQLMRSAATAARAGIVDSVFHTFSPQGVSGVVVIEESHLSIHTWPEYGYAAVDFFTCGQCIPEEAHSILKKGLKAMRSEKMLIHRGHLPGPPTMRIENHTTEQADGVVFHHSEYLAHSDAENSIDEEKQAASGVSH